MINDRRDDMTLAELVEELELSHPEKVASFERRYPDVISRRSSRTISGLVIPTTSTIWRATFEDSFASDPATEPAPTTTGPFAGRHHFVEFGHFRRCPRGCSVCRMGLGAFASSSHS